jgi:probable dihydroxyacetone kinase regulator
MANSTITKRALASAFKELMLDIPFSKITVSMICDRCGMNRKSFYYHFKDKYDLICHILDIEYFGSKYDKGRLPAWDRIVYACNYFYNNRLFYGHLIELKGQEPFYQHFVNIFEPVVSEAIRELIARPEPDMYINFYTDALIGAFERWLAAPVATVPEVFAKNLYTCLSSAIDGKRSCAKK